MNRRGPHSARHRGRRFGAGRVRRSAVLLEVVVAMTILVAATGLMAGQLAGALRMMSYAEEQLDATLLADRVLTLIRLDPAVQTLMTAEEDIESAFDDDTLLGYPLADAPGFFWRIHHELVDPEDQTLRRVELQILYQPDPESRDRIDGAVTLRQVAFLQAQRATIDLVTEAGLTEEQAEELRQLIPLPDLDLRALDIQRIMTFLDEETLAQIIPMLLPLLSQLQAGGMPSLENFRGGPPGLEGLSPEEAAELAEQLRQAAENGQMAPGGLFPGGAPGGRRGGGQFDGGAPGGGRGGGFGGRGPGQGGGRRGGGQGGQGVQDGGQGRANRPAGVGSGPNGSYTIEDLIRMRDEARQRGGR